MEIREAILIKVVDEEGEEVSEDEYTYRRGTKLKVTRRSKFDMAADRFPWIAVDSNTGIFRDCELAFLPKEGVDLSDYL